MPKLNEATWAINRDDILRVAFDLFAQRGYSRVSVNEIIKEAGISKGCFYTYFESKQAVFFAIVSDSDNIKTNLASQFDAQILPAERLKHYISQRLNHFLNEDTLKWVKFSFEFWATAQLSEEMMTVHQKRYLAFAQDIESIVISGMDLGHFKSNIDVKDYVYILMSTIDGIASMAAVMMQPLNQAAITMAIDVFISYLTYREVTK